MDFDGGCRQLLVHVPPRQDAARKLPLVVAMHGYTGDPASHEAASGLSRTADAEGFMVVYPAGVGRAWDLSVGGSDVRFLRALVARLQSRGSVDTARVYATGFSMGGAMANRAACDLSDVFAAAAPVSGGHITYNVCRPQRPVPILAIHGSADTVVPPSGDASWPPLGLWVSAWAERNGCGSAPEVQQLGEVVETAWPACAAGSEVRLLTVQGLGHTWWPGANEKLWSFFARHSLAR